ncbi:MAG TPA: hypothetical protein VGQ76_20515 [Thermoanaerobaculia bacterium]|jgi:hypothetical protein|nr:hypothetical protein [Thermoanaerobaculia bacterium]
MNRIAVVRRGIAWAGPLVVIAIPKCPLCLLPLFAIAGIAAPPRPLLDAIVIVVVLSWCGFLLFTVRTKTLRVIAVIAAALVIVGRLAPLPPVSWIGVGVMAGIAILRLAARDRACSGACDR